MANSSGVGDEVLPLDYEIVSVLDADAVSIVHDENFIYAACKDLRVRVWSKTDWQLEVELGETSSEPLAVHVDESQVYATCERRVYVWKKENWGMVGWFDLTYPAVTSALHADCLYVGAKDGRLVSIRKDTHETSSWQLHKSDLITIWSDDQILVTATKKGEPRIWNHGPSSAPTELVQLDKKARATVLVGNSRHVFMTNGSGDISVWDKVEWNHVRTIELKSSTPIISLWANELFLVAVADSGSIHVADLSKGISQGKVAVGKYKVLAIDVDESSIYLATSEGVVIVNLLLGDTPLDLFSESSDQYGLGLLRTSPYDVLEEILELQRKGDSHFKEGRHHDSVAAYEKAMQHLVDHSRVLIEVPEERQKITEELNLRLGQSLLKAKIQEITDIIERIAEVSEKLGPEGELKAEDDEIDKLWEAAMRIKKESRVLADTQAGNILSYQLTDMANTLEETLNEAMSNVNKKREKINQALALTHGIMNEWRWMERRRTCLDERKEFLEKAMKKIEDHMKNVEPGSEVESILKKALGEHGLVLKKIIRILDASEIPQEDVLISREEAESAIDGLLRVVPKRLEALSAIVDSDARLQEIEQLMSALHQALHNAKRFKIKGASKLIKEQLDIVSSLQVTPDEPSSPPMEEAEQK
ncbi:MAG: hypothetical protein ACFFAY_10840 [Promethearchaeota archaeon]